MTRQPWLDNGQTPSTARASPLKDGATATTRHSLQEAMLPPAWNPLRLIGALRHQFPKHITGQTARSDKE